MTAFKPFHPSARPAGRGITIGTPRLYDLSGNLFFFGLRRRAYRRLVEAAEVRSGDHVLDVGCGPGYFTRILAQAAGPSGTATGLDAAPEMVEYAMHKARSLDNCSFRTGSAEQPLCALCVTVRTRGVQVRVVVVANAVGKLRTGMAGFGL